MSLSASGGRKSLEISTRGELGIGLAISQRLIEVQGGEIEVESQWVLVVRFGFIYLWRDIYPSR
jgi:signal transduction histidine kinase